MNPDEIKVGATYRFNGQMRRPKRVLKYTSHGYHGGTVRLADVKPNGSLGNVQTWAGAFFVTRVIGEVEINEYPDPPAPPHGKPINFWIYWAGQRIDHRAGLACERIHRSAR